MLQLTPALTAEVGKPITKPGYLFELGFSPTLYLSTRGLQNWNGKVWGSTQIMFDGSALRVPGGDPVLSRLVQTQGVTDRVAKVWQFYGDAVTDDTILLIFDGFMDGAPSLTHNLQIDLYDNANKSMFLPRVRVRPGNDFPVLPAPGQRFAFGGVIFELEGP
jgi:hypothetical protein